jgi:hypothetical protein
MKWYLLVRNDRAVANPLVVDEEDFGGIDPETLTSGYPVVGWSREALLRASRSEDDGDPDDALQNHLGLPVFSAPLREALERAGVVGGIQFLPVRVVRPDGDEISGFAVANITECRAAMDRDRSDFDSFPEDYVLAAKRGAVHRVRRAVLNPSALANTDIVRLKEYPQRIYVSEKFRRAFDNGQFTGLSFSEAPLVAQS